MCVREDVQMTAVTFYYGNAGMIDFGVVADVFSNLSVMSIRIVHFTQCEIELLKFLEKLSIFFFEESF